MAQKTLHHFSQMRAPSRESRRRQALNLLLPTFVRGWKGGSAWPGGLRFGRRGYSEHRMLLVSRLPLYCTAPRQLRILPLLDEGDSIPILISDDRFSTIPATDGSSALAGYNGAVAFVPFGRRHADRHSQQHSRLGAGRLERSDAAPASSNKRLHVTATVRTTVGIIKGGRRRDARVDQRRLQHRLHGRQRWTGQCRSRRGVFRRGLPSRSTPDTPRTT